MTESATVEFKREYINDLYKEVIAFVNTSGGTIYVGINDDGSVCGIDNINDARIKCTDNIKDNIKPDVMAFVDIKPIVMFIGLRGLSCITRTICIVVCVAEKFRQIICLCVV